MQDILYRASIEGPRRKLVNLPFGLDIGSRSVIHYHFYNLGDNGDPTMRAQRAIQMIQRDAAWSHSISSDGRDGVSDVVLLALTHSANVRNTIKQGKAEEVVTNSIKAGEVSAQFKTILEEEVLPFRQSPLQGLNLSEIAKNPNTLAVLAVAIAGSKAPIAIIVLPVGVVAMHVAMRSGPRIARWVDKKLEKWLR